MRKILIVSIMGAFAVVLALSYGLYSLYQHELKDVEAVCDEAFHKGILDICRLVREIVRRLEDKRQRMAPFPRPRGSRYLLKYLPVGIIVSHLPLLDIRAARVDFRGGHRIFYDRAKQRIGQVHPILVHQIMQPCHQPERLRISLKMTEVLLHLFREQFFYGLPAECEIRQIPPEPLPDCELAEMPERRVPDIMDQTGALQYV